MSVVFLSHASKDDALASGLEIWLTRNGFGELFVDHSRIAGGDKWREALKEAAGSCRVVLCLVTGHWLASNECFNEFRAAWYMGKRIIPLFLLDPTRLKGETRKRLAEVQAEDQGLDLKACHSAKSGLDIEAESRVAELLKKGLRAAGALAKVGLDPEAFEIDRALRPTPFPGLASFGDENADAALFYGRSREIARTLEDLRAMRANHDPRPLVILGASGAGKSSLLKAGIIPRLRHEAPAWLPLRAFRPGSDPLLNFAEALSRSLADCRRHEAHGAIRDRLFDVWSRAERDADAVLTRQGLAALAAETAAIGARLRGAAGHGRATILISVDQAEEIARAEGPSSEALSDYLHAMLAAHGLWQLVLTIRTDSFAELQGHRRFQNLEARVYDLRTIPHFRFDNVIEAPAKRYGVETEPALIDALMNDAPKDDALPLVAFALQRLWNQYAATGRLSKAHYDAVGGLNGLIEDAAERALRGIEPGQDMAPPAGPPSKRLLEVCAQTFLPALVQINDQGATIRRVAEWSEFDDEAREMLGHFDRWRLVVRKGSEAGGGTVEVAHEALFREWSRLKAWLEPERARLEALRALHADAAAWERHQRDAAFLNHRDSRLADAETLAANANYAKRLEAKDRDYLKACRAAETVAKSRARRLKIATGALGLGVIALGVGWFQQKTIAANYFWLAQVRPYVLSDAQVRGLAPREAFRDCARDCPLMVMLPAGQFWMGTMVAVDDDNDEQPQHPVTIAAPFAVSKYEVTLAEWDACVAFGPCQPVGDRGWGRGARPAINVGWSDAKLYAAWLSELTGHEYRLLSEAEWEYAARAGRAGAYAFGEDAAAMGEHAWYLDNAESKTHPVGEKKANAFGLHDMYGNVWEWVEDCYAPNYVGAPADGSPAVTGDCRFRVIRGGNWSHAPIDLRSANRHRSPVERRANGLGFRLARTIRL